MLARMKIPTETRLHACRNHGFPIKACAFVSFLIKSFHICVLTLIQHSHNLSIVNRTISQSLRWKMMK